MLAPLPPRFFPALLSGLTGLFILTSSSAQAAFVTSGVYDEQTTQTNAVDFEATGNALSLSQFKSNLTTAFAANLGGVVDFENGTLEGTNNVSLTAIYGTGQTKRVTFTQSGGASPGLAVSNGAGASTSISGTMQLGASPTSYTLSIGSLTNSAGAADAGIASLAFTFLGRISVNFGTVTATVTFSDNTTATASRLFANGGTTTADTFFCFQAPAGLTITKLTVTNSGNGSGRLDDVAFTTLTASSTAVTSTYTYPSTVSSDAQGPLDLKAELNYDSSRQHAPIMVFMHSFSALTGHFTAFRPHAMRFRDAGFFVVTPAMREREGSDGVRDNGGVELYDVLDAVEAVKRDYPNFVDASNISITGYSGGGGNVMSALTKFPDYFRVGAAYFGMADYGYHPTNGWYFNGAASNHQAILNAAPGNPTAPASSAILDRYRARASNLASPNNPYAEIHLFVNDNEPTCPKINDLTYQSNALAAASYPGEFGNITVHLGVAGTYQDFNGNGTNESNEQQYWPHGDLTADQQHAGDTWYLARLQSGQIAEPKLKNSGSLVVAGFVRTKPFSLWLGDGQNAAGNLAYTLSTTSKRFAWQLTSQNPVTGKLIVDTSDMTGQTVQVRKNGTVIESLAGGTTYTLATMAAGDVVELIVSPPLEAWRVEHFGAGHPSGSGDQEDPDGDKLVNLLEFALALDPKKPDAMALPGLSKKTNPNDGQDYLEISYRQREGGTGKAGVDYTASGVRYTVQVSSTLNTWASGAGLVELVAPALSNGDGTETVRLRLLEPAAEQQFARLLITRTE